MILDAFTFLFLFMGFMFIVLGLLHRYGGVRMCRTMGWHLAPKEQGFDGCSATGVCPRCGERVMQDSQGNWF
jgi:hypothetical protein